MPPRTKPSTRQAWLDAMSEDDLLNHIIGMCRLYGLRTAHFAPAWTEKGYRTAVRGDGKGWPDLIIVGYKLIVRELKDAKGRPTPEQATWLKSLQLGGVDTTIWRPSHWYDGTIQRELKALSKRHTDEGGTEMGTVVHLLRRQAQIGRASCRERV